MEIFTLLLLFSDGYLRWKGDPQGFKGQDLNTRRFLEIAAKLPMVMQMTLASRVYRGTRQVIPKKQLDESLNDRVWWLDQFDQGKFVTSARFKMVGIPHLSFSSPLNAP